MWNYPLSPPQASNLAPANDAIFGLITALTLFFTVVVLLMVLIFAIRYRRGSSANRDNIVHHSQKLEYLWSIPPLILGLVIFAMSAREFVTMRTPPKDSMEIFVIGKQWMWHIQHPNGVRENNTLHVPLGKPVKLTMISQDVIHAFYVPAFRQQYHVIPGRYTTIWFTPTKEGRYPLFCNMYCGTQHSEMGGYVYVVTQAEYAKWLARGGDEKKPSVKTLADQGHETFKRLRCDNCHGINDNERGPTLNGIIGTQRKFTDGSSTAANDDYLRESIVNPFAKITQGYENTMPPDYKTLSEEDLRGLIEYLKSLGVRTPPAATGNNMNISLSGGNH
jgi:cytochrome c oxidase subunit 2